jgi:hypothetical protein
MIDKLERPPASQNRQQLARDRLVGVRGAVNDGFETENWYCAHEYLIE